ncbi:unnamed protein product [Knipowitschia caucasica]
MCLGLAEMLAVVLSLKPWSYWMYISLDCVSGRLLDKDHNMTLFLLCAGSLNTERLLPLSMDLLLVIDHISQPSPTIQHY